MTDETPPDAPHTDDAGTATAEVDGKPAKLRQTVEMRDIGPCKKYIKVTVDRQDIDARLGEKFSELMPEANVAGFRPGKAPRKLIELRYSKDVADQVKTEVLLASLEQLAEDYDVAPLAAPNIDPSKIELPKEGPLVYEFEVEVRPEFELPNYKGLKLKKPVHTFTPEEIEGEERRLLVPHGQVVPKPEGDAQVGDIIVADVTMRNGAEVINTLKEAAFRIDKQLAFRDGLAAKFGEQVSGAKAGDSRVVDVDISATAANTSLRGTTVQATFAVKEIKKVILPELTHEFLHNFGVHTPDQLRELIEVLLKRRLEYQQRQSARQQVIEQIASNTKWDLPEELLMRQSRKALARKVMEMKADGISEAEIASRRRLLEQDIVQSTALSLKEHFVLQKISEIEKIEVDEDDLNDEIQRIAEQNDESPRRLRARMERDDLLESLAAEMIERKALDLILDSAEYEEVPLSQDDQPQTLATSEEQAIPGEMRQSEAPAETPSSAPA